MSKVLFASSLVVFGMFAGNLYAKSGIIVAGENGTKWCCPDGKKGDGCEKGASTIPVGKACSFASKAVIPQEGFTQPNPTSATPVKPTKAQTIKEVDRN